MIADLFPSLVPESTGDRDSWATPLDFFKPLNERYDFTLDAAAEPWSAKCRRFWTRRDDAFQQNPRGETIWCNPPYSDLGSWVAMFGRWQEAGNLVVALLPNRTDSEWFHRHLWPLCDLRGVEFIRGRIPFVPPPGIVASSNMEGSMLAIWEPEP